MCDPGGATYTMPPASVSSSAAGLTRSDVRRPRMSATRLRWFGSTCCTTAMGNGNSGGRRASTAARAGNPPADAASVTSRKAGGEPTGARAVRTTIFRYTLSHRRSPVRSVVLGSQPHGMGVKLLDLLHQPRPMTHVQVEIERLADQLVVLALQLGHLALEP